jgi:HPt (histidine-containing phosphotransfer) domain-containing protein
MRPLEKIPAPNGRAGRRDDCPAEAHKMTGESKATPFATLDIAHLDRQTMGDRDIRREVLLLLDGQLEGYLPSVGGGTEAELLAIAHSIKGAARGTGAFALAEAASAVERSPGDVAARSLLTARIHEVRAAVAAETARGR